MHSIRIHKFIGLMISLLYLIGVWHRGDRPTPAVKEARVKLAYSIYYPLFLLSLAVGAIESGSRGESIFLLDLSIGSTVLVTKMWILTWKQNEILNLLDRVCVFSIRNDDDHKRFDEKLRGFVTFAFVFVIAIVIIGFLAAVLLPFVGSEKSLFLKIGFPLDYENNEIAFWIATGFLFTQNLLSVFVVSSTVIIWYLLFVCALRYEVLGSEIKNMGGRTNEVGSGKEADQKMHKNFFEDLKSTIDAHLHQRELTNDLGLFFSNLFFVQFAVSAVCICGSIYCLAFDIGENLLERFMHLLVFLYFIAELSMITHFGNEIKLSSDRLSYSLFESDWYNQPQSTKKRVIIFGEYLKQPQQLVIAKLYPLTLETFTRILNSAYSMFNILKSFQ